MPLTNIPYEMTVTITRNFHNIIDKMIKLRQSNLVV